MSNEKLPIDVKDVFLFVNPTSGGNLGAAYTDLGKDLIQLDDVPDHGKVNLHIYDIRKGSPGNKPGFKVFNERLNEVRGIRPFSHTISLIGGGDGTVMWATIEHDAHGNDSSEYVVAVIPMGTGNDFARTLGWGGLPPRVPVGKDMVNLKKTLKDALDAHPQAYDLWTVEIETNEGGGFKFIKDKKKTLTDGMRGQHNITDLPGGGMKMVKPLCNYFSIGYDARVGLGFDKNRTTSATANLWVYFKEGFKKGIFKKPPTIEDVVQDIQLEFPNGDKKTIITTDKDRKKTEPSFIGNPIELMFLNIPSIGKGANIWGTCHRAGLLGANRQRLEKEIMQGLSSEDQVVGDKQLTVLTYGGPVSFSADLSKAQAGCHGLVKSGKRIMQTRNAKTVLNFKDKEHIKVKDERGQVYMEIDGEFFIVEYPKSTNLLHKKQIWVLRKDKPITQGCCIPPKHFVEKTAPARSQSGRETVPASVMPEALPEVEAN